MTKTPLRVAVAAVLGLVALLATSADAATRTVRVGSYYFEDARPNDSRVEITQGDTITFVFEGKAQHTATVDGWFTSGVKSPGQRYTTFPLTRVGSFTLYCEIHGAPRHGTALIVRRRPAPSPSPTRARRTPTPVRTTAAPRPSPSPTTPHTQQPSPTPPPSPTPRPTPPSPSPRPSPTAPSTVATSPSPSHAESAAPDVLPAAPIDDSGPGWELPVGGLAAALLLTAAVARTRRTRD